MSQEGTSGKVLGISTTASATSLPFTGGHPVIQYLLATILLASVLVIISKLVKFVATIN